MNLTDYILMAFKNLTRQKARTFLTIIAITVGSLSLTLMMSIIVSIRVSLLEQFQQLGAFNLVTVAKDPNSVDSNSLIGNNGDPSEGKKMDDTTLVSMKELQHVVEATPTIQVNIGTMRLTSQEKKTWGNITAYDPSNDVFNIPLVTGRKLISSDMDKILVGSRFLEETGYTGNPKDLIGKTVTLTSKMGGGSAPDWGPLPQKPPENPTEDWYKSQQNKGVDITAEIVGILQNGNVDSGGSYITLAWGRKLMTNIMWKQTEVKNENNNNCTNVDKKNGRCIDQPYTPPSPVWEIQKDDQFLQNGYSSIILKVDDTKNISAVADEVKKLGYGANTAQNMLDQINKILALIGAVLAVIGGISLFVAAIGIINTMIMATYERMREIGVMRACGATKATIRHLFTFEAALLGFWGGVFGILISVTLGGIAKLLVTKFGISLGNIPIDQIGTFPWYLIISVIVFTTFLGMMAGLYPANSAAKMNPVDALRYE